MKVSLNIVKQYINFELPSADELVARINSQLGGVEQVIDLGDRYKDVIIVKIIRTEKHPDADRLSVCLIDDGGVREGVPRDEDGYVQVVCGAPNVREGMFVAWLPPAATVPASYEEKELFVLDARKLRGVLSQGMLAAADELAIGSDHDGILEINPEEWKLSGEVITPGASFAKVYGLDDKIIDIENKMFTHRPDLFGQIGVAREISAILSGVTDPTDDEQDTRYANPDWYWLRPEFTQASGLDLTVINETPAHASRFMTVCLEGVAATPSPLWLQCALVAMGSKPINVIVDITNYVMLMTAQPVHAYDYDKLRGASLGVRMARKGETVTLLNHKTYELHEDDIVIVDGEGPVGLAGIMGGAESEVSEETKRVVLEVATFDMYTVRKTAMRHGVFTDALTRYNKGQSPLQNPRIMKLLLQLFGDYTTAVQASNVTNNSDPQWDDAVSIHGEIRISTDFINKRLGVTLTATQVAQLLRRVNMAVSTAPDTSDTLLVTAPFWRTDIELKEDVVEEVGRLYGFDKLPRELPARSSRPTPKNQRRILIERIRQSLSRAGANEVLGYSFVNRKLLERVGQNPDQAFRLSNALSPDLQYYRLSVTPSLLDKVNMNIRAGYDEFALFESAKVHSKSAISESDGLPVAMARLGLTYAAKTAKPGAPYYQVKALLEQLARDLGLNLEYKALPGTMTLSFAVPFEPLRSARVIDSASGQVIGVIGEYKRLVRQGFKLPDYSAGFELLPEGIELALHHATKAYVPLSRYPYSERDICFRVAATVAYGDIVAAVEESLKNTQLTHTVTPIDIYQPEAGGAKNVTLRLTLVSADKTLTAEEVNGVISTVAGHVIQKVDASVV